MPPSGQVINMLRLQIGFFMLRSFARSEFILPQETSGHIDIPNPAPTNSLIV